jgi:hypothetical protein
VADGHLPAAHRGGAGAQGNWPKGKAVAEEALVAAVAEEAVVAAMAEEAMAKAEAMWPP